MKWYITQITQLDVNSGMDAGMSWGGFGVRSAIQVATTGISMGFNGGNLFGNQIAGLVSKTGSFGSSTIGSTLLKGTEIMTTNMATSAISSMDFSAIGKKNFFDSGSFAKGAFGKNAMTSVAVGMAGSLAQGASGDYLKKITNSSDKTKYAALSGMIGGLTSTGVNYGLTGNAQVNLLNTNMLSSLGLRDSHGNAVNTGLFELSFGKDGVHGALGMGGTDVSAGTIAGAMSDVQSAYGEYKKVEAAKQAVVLQSMLRDMNFSNTGANDHLQIGADTAGKDALDKMNPVSDEDGKLPGFINPFAKQNDGLPVFIRQESQNLSGNASDSSAEKLKVIKDKDGKVIYIKTDGDKNHVTFVDEKGNPLGNKFELKGFMTQQLGDDTKNANSKNEINTAAIDFGLDWNVSDSWSTKGVQWTALSKDMSAFMLTGEKIGIVKSVIQSQMDKEIQRQNKENQVLKENDSSDWSNIVKVNTENIFMGDLGKERKLGDTSCFVYQEGCQLVAGVRAANALGSIITLDEAAKNPLNFDSTGKLNDSFFTSKGLTKIGPIEGQKAILESLNMLKSFNKPYVLFGSVPFNGGYHTISINGISTLASGNPEILGYETSRNGLYPNTRNFSLYKNDQSNYYQLSKLYYVYKK